MLRACTSCGCYARSTELACPHCGARLSPDGSGSPLGRASAAVLLGLGLGLAGCADKDMQAMYGVPYTGDSTDADGDGWTVEDGDCDDENEEINPGATETTGDGIDSNCDGGDDT